MVYLYTYLASTVRSFFASVGDLRDRKRLYSPAPFRASNSFRISSTASLFLLSRQVCSWPVFSGSGRYSKFRTPDMR
ncbi:hypothetical protein JW905_05030 [bacterium]|nr:hypothetical protein [candidate division CSSED10-310 bacterium]